MSAPTTVDECRRFLNHARRHRCVACGNVPVKRINSIVRESGGHRITVFCHGEITSEIIPDSHIEACGPSTPIRWFDSSRTRDQLARLDRHGRITSTTGDSWQDSSAPYRQRGEK